jgi:predicted nucleic acid-binding protein
MTIGLDTMTVIWGLQASDPKGGNSRQADLIEMRQRAAILLDVLETSKETIIIPNIVVSELLIKVELAEHGNFLAELQKRFFIPLFDLRASALAASLWLQHKALPKDEHIARTTLKSDVMIVATAKVAGAAKFYTHDKKVRKLANLAGMMGLDLPTHHPDMFRDAEIKGKSAQ